ncbi:MAG: 30S ribosomal protein S7 [Candidatus Spechtbacterales bacterium]|nr:30S ribosomal protein S7 [Candidatus Spechtbacterales bacterium]
MRKKGGFKKRQLQPDYKYNNPLVTKFINYMMWDGKKSVARKVVYDAFDIIQKKTKKDPMDVFDAALKNVSPSLEVKTRRIGGANYQVPMQVKGDRRTILAMRWIREAARSKSGTAMSQRLANELISASNNEGDAIRKKETTERMARANRAFAHFA